MANQFQDEDIPGGVLWNPHQQYSKEMRKWEAYPSAFGPAGKPYRFEQYPLAMYKANKIQGKVRCYEGEPDPMNYPDQNSYERACRDVVTLNQRSFRTVPDEVEERKAMNDGWRRTIADALAAFESREREVGNESAKVLHDVERMSANAQAEFAAAGAATSQHVVDVAPKRKRGRPAKGVRPVTGTGVSDE